MLDDDDFTRGIVLDAAPLIYLAKLEALDVLEALPVAIATPSVIEEATRPSMAYRHPDAVLIEQAVSRGDIGQVSLDAGELAEAGAIEQQVAGLHAGECEVLAVARARNLAAVIFERPGRRVARASGIRLVDTVELLFAGTADQTLLERRIRGFARLSEMRLADVEALLARTERRRP